MSIYSRNRSGAALLAGVSANESYMESDIGTILAETEINDMAFFEAIMYSDLAEMNALREGTLLEADAKAANKGFIKTNVDKLVELLQKLWAKIKALFKSAAQKIASYTSSDGVKIANAVKAALKEKNWTGSIEVDTYDHAQFTMPEGIHDELFANNTRKEIFAKWFGDESMNPGKFTKQALKDCKKTITINSGNVASLYDVIANSKQTIADLKHKQDSIERSINLTASKIKADADKFSDIAAVNSQVNAFQAVVTAYANAAIAACRANIGATRVALTKILHDVRKIKNEAAIMEAYDEINMAFTCPIELNPQIASMVESMMA